MALVICLMFSLVFLVQVMQAPTASSWGWDTHRFIETKAERVFANDPSLSDIFDFLTTYHSYIYSWCTYPDSKKDFMPDGSGAADWHYLDAESYDPLPYRGQYDGDLPWAMKLILDNIVYYLKNENWVTAAQLMGAICHFTGDATMPLHSTWDYSIGGMHTTFESVANGHSNDSEMSIPTDYVPQYLDDITNAALVTLAGSFDFTDEDPHGGTNLSDFLENGITWNDWIKSMTENRIRVAVQFTADVWYTAFVQAGLLDQSPSPTPSATPTDYTPYIVGGILAIAVIGIVLVLYVRRH
jgi:hypothetical protein